MEEIEIKHVPIKHIGFHQGDFLNLPGFHSDASILSTVVLEERTTYVNTMCNIWINDCNKTICLDISIDKEERDNTLHKVDKLIANLQGLRKALPKTFKQYDQIRAKQDKKLEDESRKTIKSNRLRELVDISAS